MGPPRGIRIEKLLVVGLNWHFISILTVLVLTKAGLWVYVNEGVCSYLKDVAIIHLNITTKLSPDEFVTVCMKALC